MLSWTSLPEAMLFKDLPATPFKTIVKNTFIEVQAASEDDDEWLISGSPIRQRSDSLLQTSQAQIERRECAADLVRNEWSSNHAESSSSYGESNFGYAESSSSYDGDGFSRSKVVKPGSGGDSTCDSLVSLEPSEGIVKEAKAQIGISGCTTLMVRHVPTRFTQSKFAKEVDSCGFKGRYDFLYLPSEHRLRANRGFAFINFVSATDADAFYKEFQGGQFPSFESECDLEILPADLQGYEENVTKYLASSNGRRKKNDYCKPMFLRSFPGAGDLSRGLAAGVAKAPDELAAIESARFCPFCGNVRKDAQASFCGFCGQCLV